jgi:hypothetical protein
VTNLACHIKQRTKNQHNCDKCCEEHRLKGNEIIGNWMKSSNEELYALQSTPNAVGVYNAKRR